MCIRDRSSMVPEEKVSREVFSENVTKATCGEGWLTESTMHPHRSPWL